MLDRTGKQIQKGQTVDVLLSGIFTGVIVDLREAPLAVSRNKMAPPQIAIQLIVQHVPADGMHAGVYIVGESQSATVGLIS